MKMQKKKKIKKWGVSDVNRKSSKETPPWVNWPQVVLFTNNGTLTEENRQEGKPTFYTKQLLMHWQSEH